MERKRCGGLRRPGRRPPRRRHDLDLSERATPPTRGLRHPSRPATLSDLCRNEPTPAASLRIPRDREARTVEDAAGRLDERPTAPAPAEWARLGSNQRPPACEEEPGPPGPALSFGLTKPKTAALPASTGSPDTRRFGGFWAQGGGPYPKGSRYLAGVEIGLTRTPCSASPCRFASSSLPASSRPHRPAPELLWRATGANSVGGGGASSGRVRRRLSPRRSRCRRSSAAERRSRRGPDSARCKSRSRLPGPVAARAVTQPSRLVVDVT
jgi:hypothetical protein